MTLVLELTATQETELRRRADAVGLSPSDYLLSAAQIGTSTGNLTEQKAGDLPVAPPGESAYDLFAGLIGGFASGKANPVYATNYRLQSLAGTLSKEDAAAMQQDIDHEFGRIDAADWE